MIISADEIVSAQVVLRSATGNPVDGSSVITVKTLGEYLPSPEAVARGMAFFTSQGFMVEAAVGISFSISAPAEIFVRQFGVNLCRSTDGGIKTCTGGEEGDYELPLDSLPEDIREITLAITFTPPPAFGPTGFV